MFRLLLTRPRLSERSVVLGVVLAFSLLVLLQWTHGPKYRFSIEPSSRTQRVMNTRRSWTDAEVESNALIMMKENLHKKFTIVTVANIGLLELTLNWVASLKVNGYDKFVIFCFDWGVLESLVARGLANHVSMIPRSWSPFEVSSAEHKYNSDQYNKLLEARVFLQVKLFELGFWIVASDVDLVFLSPYVLDHINYIIGDRCAGLNSTNCAADFLYMVDNDIEINGGFFAVRPTPVIIDYFKSALSAIELYKIDQLAINAVVGDRRFSKPFRGLDFFLFSSGRVFFLERKNEQMGIKPLVVHANYFTGTEVKRELFRANGMWFI